MNQQLHSAYMAHQNNQEENIRETEAKALLSCASRLEVARQDDCTREYFADALRHNQQLWTLFQACLLEADNPLPKDLKILLLNISGFVDKTTFRALGTRNKELLRSLVNINRTIAAGLRKTPSAQDTTQITASSKNAIPDSLMTSA